ncbi:hypothetical protein GCM10010343_13720 [Streptomyces avidinii]|uniref:Uncharacterized protein n=1 Tax=Streptomyces avidinii TaxID=1895 RepID=A0ABS4KXX3_STRAV|nr:hypothetical protein [Streptomyces avidinii]GGY89705.1 hypothetical protein GCM10010343_13720 [Streptomyces avidinii]
MTLAVMQAVLGFASETRWLRFARAHLSAEFPYLPEQASYNKRLRAAASLISRFIRTLVKRSDLAGWAGYGYCPSRPARPRTPRSQNPSRGPGPRRTMHPGPDRRHLAQPDQRHTPRSLIAYDH